MATVPDNAEVVLQYHDPRINEVVSTTANMTWGEVKRLQRINDKLLAACKLALYDGMTQHYTPTALLSKLAAAIAETEKGGE